ncbi:MAG: acyl-CoA dehydrogenase family protein [Planctomycetes bacterium]|nr:acyl-CoA dehydrogenase family protein [Planctomycetota bacterium]
MTGKETERDKQVKQAEELLFSGPQKLGFGKSLFFGRYAADWVTPYPRVPESERPRVEASLAELTRFVEQSLDTVAIDRAADIPRDVIRELGRLGVLGMTAPVELGGRGFSQLAYCKMLDVVGAHCASTSVFINAHHSIGMRGLLLFGTESQKSRWLRPLISGEQLAAFALTEPEAGSDAANVQTTATPSADGSHYVLNGQKRYITNGAIAQVLTVMARTPIPGTDKTAITAFLVTPDMPGFEVVESRMEKLGIRGTVTSRLAFHGMKVPKENILGPLGKGLKVALTVLDFGRTTFGACCTGAARACLRLSVEHVNHRRQFGKTLGDFELVRKKIALMAANLYAMEAMTHVTAGLIDRGLEDYMLETAMLKVFTTEALWTSVNDAFQVHGGAAYFTNKPLERMLRDARINQIGEGANDVLRSFIALVGIRGPAEELLQLKRAMTKPWKAPAVAWRFGAARVLGRPVDVPVRHALLRPHANHLGVLIRSFDQEIRHALFVHRENILDRQYVHERIAEAAMSIYASACVLSRLDDEMARPGAAAIDPAAYYFLKISSRRIAEQLASLRDNDDNSTTAAAEDALRGG